MCAREGPFSNTSRTCAYLCNATSCDNMHPTDRGYRAVGQAVHAAVAPVLEGGTNLASAARESLRSKPQWASALQPS